MTEYDYSPQARERYIEKQLAIARWVDETNHYPPANPFLSSEAPGTSDSVQRPDFASPDYNPDSDSYFGHYSSRDRRRSGDDSHHRRRSNHGSPRTSHSARRHLRSSSSPPSPHTSYPRAAPTSNQYPYLYAPGYAQPQHSQDRYPSNAATITPPMSSPQPYTPYGRSSPNQPILIPMNGREGGYYLVQPRGVTYQVVQPQQSPSSSQPWYKRVFSPTPSTSNSGKHKPARSSSNGGHKRRGRKWDWDIY